MADSPIVSVPDALRQNPTITVGCDQNLCYFPPPRFPCTRRTGHFMKLGEPNLFFGVAAGNMNSNRPHRATLVYSQR